MRSVSVIAGVLLSGCAHGVVAPSGARPDKYAGQPKEVPGLSLRGQGCHVDVIDSDGTVICKGIAFPVPKCSPLTVLRTGANGAMTGERFSLGSDCPAPRFSSGVIGPGGFFVEGKSGGFEVICDDASKCQRSVLREQILDCCHQEKAIRNTAVCNVAPHEGVCSELDE